MAQAKTRAGKRDSAKALRIVDVSLRRIGATPRDRLKWLFDFANADFDQLYDEEKIALGYELSTLVALKAMGTFKSEFIKAKGRPPDLKEFPPQTFTIGISESLLRDAQADLKKRLAQLFSDEGENAGIWPVPIPTALFYRRHTPLDAKRVGLTLSADVNGSGPDATKKNIIYLFTDIIGNAQHLLRACAECHTPFMPVRRQEYCSVKCSQRVRDRKRKPRPSRQAPGGKNVNRSRN